MPKSLANRAPHRLEFRAIHGDRAIRLAGSHGEFAFDKGGDIVTAEIVDDIEAVLLPGDAFLHQDAVVGVGRAGSGQRGARQMEVEELVGGGEFLLGLHMHDADGGGSPARLDDQWELDFPGTQGLLHG